MAPWGDAKLFFCILFITCCCTVTLGQMTMDCCLTVKNKTVEKAAIADHRRQISGQGCSLDAMILVTRRGIKLCVPADEPWVHDVVKHVDSVKRHCQKNNYKGKRCFGVRRQ
ncbi:C-C motif chemokine 19-like [Chaetodon trifascialis]|uniref:C-C motif chemokine 19-like n=1 Tax=Chaetodon trifascialis TaxID=109706 RepID=UPI003995B729